MSATGESLAAADAPPVNANDIPTASSTGATSFLPFRFEACFACGIVEHSMAFCIMPFACLRACLVAAADYPRHALVPSREALPCASRRPSRGSATKGEYLCPRDQLSGIIAQEQDCESHDH